MRVDVRGNASMSDRVEMRVAGIVVIPPATATQRFGEIDEGNAAAGGERREARVR